MPLGVSSTLNVKLRARRTSSAVKAPSFQVHLRWLIGLRSKLIAKVKAQVSSREEAASIMRQRPGRWAATASLSECLPS
jgi:hypothetical protein